MTGLRGCWEMTRNETCYLAFVAPEPLYPDKKTIIMLHSEIKDRAMLCRLGFPPWAFGECGPGL